MSLPGKPKLKSLLHRCVNSRVTGWLLIALVLVVWEVQGRLGNPMFPPLTRIGELWFRDIRNGSLAKATLQTLLTVLHGFAIGAVLGVGIGFLMGISRPLWGALEPITEWLRLTPVAAVVLLIVFFMGTGYKVHVFLTAYAAFFPVLLNTYAGARAVPKTQLETAKTFQVGWLRSLCLISFPNALPFIVVGLRYALGSALLLAIMAGLLAGHGGLGYYILMAQTNFNSTQLFAGLLTAFALGYGLNLAFLIIERRLDYRTRPRQGV